MNFPQSLLRLSERQNCHGSAVNEFALAKPQPQQPSTKCKLFATRTNDPWSGGAGTECEPIATFAGAQILAKRFLQPSAWIYLRHEPVGAQQSSGQVKRIQRPLLILAWSVRSRWIIQRASALAGAIVNLRARTSTQTTICRVCKWAGFVRVRRRLQVVINEHGCYSFWSVGLGLLMSVQLIRGFDKPSILD